jgi:hypothetical protein
MKSCYEQEILSMKNLRKKSHVQNLENIDKIEKRIKPMDMLPFLLRKNSFFYKKMISKGNSIKNNGVKKSLRI